MRSLILYLLAFPFLQSAAAAPRPAVLNPALLQETWTCREGEVRYRMNGELHQEKADFCTNSNRTRFVSRNCFAKNAEKLAAKPACRAFSDRSLSERFTGSVSSQVGSPAFQLCRVLVSKASPLLVEYEVAPGKWVESDRCLFEDDGSFVDSSTLWGTQPEYRAK